MFCISARVSPCSARACRVSDLRVTTIRLAASSNFDLHQRQERLRQLAQRAFDRDFATRYRRPSRRQARQQVFFRCAT